MPSDLKFAFDQSMVATRQFGIKPMMLFHGGTRAWSRGCSGYGARKQRSATVMAEGEQHCGAGLLSAFVLISHQFAFGPISMNSKKPIPRYRSVC